MFLSVSYVRASPAWCSGRLAGQGPVLTSPGSARTGDVVPGMSNPALSPRLHASCFQKRDDVLGTL